MQPPCPACKPGGADRIQPLLGAVCFPLQHRPAQAVAEGSAPGQGAGAGAAPEWGGAWHTGDQDASPTSPNRFGLSADTHLINMQMGPLSDWLLRKVQAYGNRGSVWSAHCCTPLFPWVHQIATDTRAVARAACQPSGGAMTMPAVCPCIWPVACCLWQLPMWQRLDMLPATADCRPQRCQSWCNRGWLSCPARSRLSGRLPNP